MNNKNLANPSILSHVENKFDDYQGTTLKDNLDQTHNHYNYKSGFQTLNPSRTSTFRTKLKYNLDRFCAKHPQQSIYYQNILNFTKQLERKEQEKNHYQFMNINLNRRTNFQFRDQCISYFFDMGSKHNYKRQTIYLAISIYDSYGLVYCAENQTQVRQIAVACLLIAGKYVEYMPPSLRKIKIQFYQDDIIKRQGKILLALNFNLTKWTALDHLEYLFQLFGIPFQDAQLCRLFLDVSIYNHKLFSRTKPQIHALGVLLCSAKIFNQEICLQIYQQEKKEIYQCGKQVLYSFKKGYPSYHKPIFKFEPSIRNNCYLSQV